MKNCARVWVSLCVYLSLFITVFFIFSRLLLLLLLLLLYSFASSSSTWTMNYYHVVLHISNSIDELRNPYPRNYAASYALKQHHFIFVHIKNYKFHFITVVVVIITFCWGWQAIHEPKRANTSARNTFNFRSSFVNATKKKKETLTSSFNNINQTTLKL